jgi:two-component SAPR family response regulator
METGDHLKAKERLEESMVLLRKLTFEAPLKKTNATRGDQCLFRIQMFGPVRVFYQEKELDAACWRTVKVRHLLAYLAHQNKPVSTDQIMEDLWPDLDTQRASALFHTTLYYLRRLLQQFSAEELIIRGSKRYQLRPGRILNNRFEFEAKATSVLGKPMTKALAEELEAATQLYSGDYLQDLDYQWVIPVQEEMKQLYTESRQKLAVYYLKKAMYSRSVLHLKEIMKLKPYSEEIVQLLLTNYAAMGDQLAVKKEFTAFTAMIAEELGIKPSFELVEFYKEISMV